MAEIKILLVDDEENVLHSLHRALRDDGYQIFTAGSAENALPIIETEDISLIICDYKLPEMNGLDFLTKVYRKNPDIISILLTGHADLSMAVEAVNKGCLYKFILKPWNNEDLAVTVQRALEQRELVLKNKVLLSEVRERDRFLRKLEKKHPGITYFKKDSSGRFILD